MGLIETILLTVGFSISSTLLIIGVLRAGGPVISKLFGAVVRTRAELDADRDRIIAGLRAWNADLETRLKLTEARAVRAEEEVLHLNEFIDTLLSKMGTTREKVENGEPLPVYRPRRPRATRAD